MAAHSGHLPTCNLPPVDLGGGSSGSFDGLGMADGHPAQRVHTTVSNSNCFFEISIVAKTASWTMRWTEICCLGLSLCTRDACKRSALASM